MYLEKDGTCMDQVLNLRIALGVDVDGTETILIGPKRDIVHFILEGRDELKGVYQTTSPQGSFILSACELFEADDEFGIESKMISSLNNLGCGDYQTQRYELDRLYANQQNPLYLYYDMLYRSGIETGYIASQSHGIRIFDLIKKVCAFGNCLGCDMLSDNWDIYNHSSYEEMEGRDGRRYVLSNTDGVGSIIQFSVDYLRQTGLDVIKDLGNNKYYIVRMDGKGE